MGVGIAVDSSGNRHVIVGTSERNGYIRPGVSLLPGEVLATGAGGSHAEIDIKDVAEARGWTLIGVGATRPACAACQDTLDRGGRAVCHVKVMVRRLETIDAPLYIFLKSAGRAAVSSNMSSALAFARQLFINMKGFEGGLPNPHEAMDMESLSRLREDYDNCCFDLEQQGLFDQSEAAFRAARLISAILAAQQFERAPSGDWSDMIYELLFAVPDADRARLRELLMSLDADKDAAGPRGS
jgi:hypothetical protein